MIDALIFRMLQTGALDNSDIEAITDRLEVEGRGDEAHRVRLFWLEASMPPKAPENPRRALSIVRGGKPE